jgi:chemotaxis protein MotB
MRTLVLAILVVALGCGVPKPEYDAAINDANTAKQAQKSAEQQLADAQKLLADAQKDIADLKTKLDALQSGKSGDASELEELRRQRAAAEARAKLFDDLVEKLKKMIDAGKLEVSMRRGQIVLGLGTDVLFDLGKTDLKPEGEQALVEVAKVLRTLPTRRFQVAGHTDNLPIKTKEFPTNWELSTARAVVVVKLLLKEGVAASVLSAAGYAEFDPIGSNAAVPGRARNRRIEIVLVPNVEDLGLQLKQFRVDADEKKPETADKPPEAKPEKKPVPKKKTDKTDKTDKKK